MLELIQPISKRDQVVKAMKEAILSGTIEPGAAVVESKIAQQLGTGVPLIREALIELEHQGFVQRTPRGRVLTRIAFGHLDLPMPASPPAQLALLPPLPFETDRLP